MRLPNLNALRMFDASARHLNFRLAAAELNVTQGAVAQQIRGLETDLGEKLFHRLPRGLSLTDAGTRLHPPIARAMALIQDATAAFHSAPQYLRLSVPPSFAAKWLVPRLAGFQLAHPDIDLDIVASESKAELGKTADMAVRQGPTPSDPGVETMLLAPLNLCAVASPGFAARIGPQTDVAALMAHPLIQDGHRHWDRFLADAILPIRPRVLHFNQTALAMDAAANGQGIALIPQLYLQGMGDKLVQLWAPTGLMTPDFVTPGVETHGFHILWPRGKTPSPAATLLRDWLLAQAQMPAQTQTPTPP